MRTSMLILMKFLFFFRFDFDPARCLDVDRA